MKPARVLVVGSGKRVREDALPVLARLSERCEVAGVVSRKPKEIEVEGARVEVGALGALDAGRLAEVDVVYVCVSKQAVPAVLRGLAELDPAHVRLLIETPVLLYKHLGHLRLLDAFRSVSVTEDCWTLPCFDPVREVLASGVVGPARSVELDRSGYAYHAFAMARAVLGSSPVASARRARSGGGSERMARFAGGGALRVVEPRDYAVGTLRIVCERGAIGDGAAGVDSLRLAPVVEEGAVVGYRAGDVRCELDERERSLMDPAPPGEGGVTRAMGGMKRVGFLRLVRRVLDGGAAYPLDDALDDAAVDYHLEKIGRYVANPLTSPRHGLARLALRALTRLAGG